MIVLVAFAFVSGVITILSPCILPVLPIVLSGGVGGGRARPFGVLVGFIVSFTVFTLTLSAIVQALGIPAVTMRYVAVGLIVLFGIVMIVPWLRDRFEIAASAIARRGTTSGQGGTPASRRGWAGFVGGIVVGLGLGLIWTPCVGPIMASVITLASSQHLDGGAIFITLAYTLGTSIPMLGVMIGGRALLTRVPALTRNAPRIQQVFGVVMILVAVAIGFGWDIQFQKAVLLAFPNYGSGLTALEKVRPVQSALTERTTRGAPAMTMSMKGLPGQGAFKLPDQAPENAQLSDYGAAPEFVTRGSWFNTEALVAAAGQMEQGTSLPLTLAALKGKVVVVDFWTYSCVNCVRTLPYLRAWYDAYKDKGLVLIGVHTPEFEFEKDTGNVGKAIRDLKVTWPVVQDNQYAQWNSYSNQYWPAIYFMDAKGHVRYFHFGEGDYDVDEKVIQELLAEAGANVGGIVSKPAPEIDAATAETYLGYARGANFATAVAPTPDAVVDYKPARVPQNGEWNLTGKWTIAEQYVIPDTSGTLQLGFDAKNVFLVIEPVDRGSTVSVQVDNAVSADTPDVKKGALAPAESRMYQLVGLSAPGPHVLRLDVKGKIRLFAFTFG